MGRFDRERRRREQVLGFDGDIRSVGRLGRFLRSRSAAASGLRRTGVPRRIDRYLSVRKEESRVARSIRNGERLTLCRRSLRPVAALGCGHARDLARRTASISINPRENSYQSRRPRMRPISCVSRPICEFPTSSEPRLGACIRHRVRRLLGAFAAVHGPCHGTACARLDRSGKDRARRLHRTGKPQLR